MIKNGGRPVPKRASGLATFDLATGGLATVAALGSLLRFIARAPSTSTCDLFKPRCHVEAGNRAGSLWSRL